MEPQEDCKQCGNRVSYSEFEGGVCRECYRANQDAVELHNAQQDQWNKLSPAQRDAAISWATNHFAV